jgi:hypothetical protein
MALVYKRADVRSNEYTVVLNGLIPAQEYTLYDIDAPDKAYTLTGEQLMGEGYTLELPKGEKAIVLMFEAK